MLAKKRAELARVLERLADPDLRPGIARELRKHVAPFSSWKSQN